MNDAQVKDRQWWEQYFSVDGGWERNGGRDQSRLFAEAFTKRIQIDHDARISVLDVGCALGEAVRHFSRVFPNALLHGIDFSETAIARCRRDLGGVGVFEVRDMMEVEGRFDLIYVSNVLEHFADFAARGRKLMQHCRRLCILVPYRELADNQTLLAPDPQAHHQHTFDDGSFDFLIKEGLATSIQRSVFSCFPAWGWSFGERVEQRLKNVVRPWLGRKTISEPLQILYDLSA